MPINEKMRGSLSDLPIYNIWREVHRVRWEKDRPEDPLKSYFMACFSELSYLKTSRYDLYFGAERSRFDVIDSLALRLLTQHRETLELDELIERTDFGPVVIERERYLYLLLHIRDVLVIAVRGTVGIGDWILDLSAWPQTHRNIEGVHSGFWDEAADASPHLKKCVRPDISHIYFTGHSLGGAVASILAQMWASDPRVRHAIVFGTPRFGNEAYVARRRPLAFIKPNDIVPHAPPRAYGYADAERIPRSVTNRPVPRYGLGVAAAWLNPFKGTAFAHEHSVERYRRLMGLRIDPVIDFPDLVYLDAIKSAYRL